MLCPKCKEYFEEGSRRFCPTDGSRLVSDTGSLVDDRAEGGIFANLIPKIEGIKQFDEINSDLPSFTLSQPEVSSAASGPTRPEIKDEVVFEFDNSDGVPPARPSPKPMGRKVNPNEIPAGHVNLEDRAPGMAAEFDTTDPERFVGRTVKGRYSVTEFLGGDESGLAYLADDKIVENRMVLVRILTGGETDEIMDSILAEERVSLSHFTHPNIARLIDSGQFTDGTNFLVSEYMYALSVRDILSIHGKFPAERAARIIRQASSALNEAHQEGILHRDVRPENLIVDTTGETEQTILVNFGASNGEPTPTNIAYKAHEVLHGRISTVSSDIFSLAAVAFEMLTGRLPFAGESARELVRSQNRGLDLASTDSRSELRPALDEIFTRAFALNPADRYAKARDFGDTFCSALAESDTRRVKTAAIAVPIVKTQTLRPIVSVPAPTGASDTKPINDGAAPELRPNMNMFAVTPAPTGRSVFVPILGALGLLVLVGGLWYYFFYSPPAGSGEPGNAVANTDLPIVPPASPAAVNAEQQPPARTISVPPNSTFYQNSRQNVKGDLLRNFVGFSLYYPKDWKVNGPTESGSTKTRGKFLDISRLSSDDILMEQMLISYYASSGTFAGDALRFSQLVKETNETLKNLPGYRMISEQEIKFNGDRRAYEMKFQAEPAYENGKKIHLWGRRLFVPAERPGARIGFEITMLATSADDDVRGVDDIGVRGELASILNSFEPTHN
ncbi:MAG TPA: serine/threonine-protein kinase [Pyrinomonadaceae bacterium]|nr:serine/threonine-protein kinase [Pyrinomonadaceae bacterium]